MVLYLDAFARKEGEEGFDKSFTQESPRRISKCPTNLAVSEKPAILLGKKKILK